MLTSGGRRLLLVPVALGLAFASTFVGAAEARSDAPERVQAWRLDPQQDRSVWTVAVDGGEDATRVYVAGRLAHPSGSLWVREGVVTGERGRRWVHVRIVRPGPDYHGWTRTHRVQLSSTQAS